jgi:transposase
VDAIFYVNRTGVQWRYLPHDFPRWDVVYSSFRKWGKDGSWGKMQRLPAKAFGKWRAAKRRPAWVVWIAGVSKGRSVVGVTAQRFGRQGVPAGGRFSSLKA